MRALPIVERELLTASRKRSTYWSRTGAAVASIGILAFVAVRGAVDGVALSVQGSEIFHAVGGFAFVFALLSGLRCTADSLSEERREGTLGLLFLTDLRGYDVVTGKFVAGSIDAALGLAGMIPVMAVAWLLGGVSQIEFAFMTVTLANTLFWSLAAGLFVSAINQQERKALAGTVLILVVQTFGPFAIGYYYLALSEQMGRTYAIDWLFLTPSPFQAYRLTQDSRAGWTWEIFWTTTAFVHVTAWLFLSVAAFYAPSSGRLRPASAFKERMLRVWKEWSQGPSALRQNHRARLLDLNPYAWLACRDRLKLTLVWLMLGGLGVVWVWAYLKFPEMMLDDDAILLVMIIAHGLLKWWVASEVCSRSVEDQRSGALELLLCTPFSLKSMISGMGWAVLRQFGVPLVLVVLCDALMLYFMQARTGNSYFFIFYDWSPAPFCKASLFLLPLDLWAITWLAMRNGFQSSSVNRAMGMTVFRILFLPYLLAIAVYYLVLVGMHMAMYRRGTTILWGQHGLYYSWLFCCVVIPLTSGWLSRRRLAATILKASVGRFTRGKPA